jgi:putative hydrolase
MAGDSGNEPDPWANNPFSAMPMFGEMAKALAGQGPLNWDAARQFAAMAAPPSANVDPSVRIALEGLARIAELHVRDVTGFDGVFPGVNTVTTNGWAQSTLEAYRPLFTDLATSLGQRPAADADTDGAADPMSAMLGQLGQMMAPSLMGMAVGSMVGRMAQRAFGQYDLPIPRVDAANAGGAALLMVPTNIDKFAADWSVPTDEMRLWVISQELIGHVLLSTGNVAADLSGLVRRYAGAFRPDPSAVADKLGALDDDDDPMQALQKAFSDPALLLGAIQSPEQSQLAPQLDAAVAAVVGYVDYHVDSVAARVIGGNALQIAEAVRRRRTETSNDDIYIERLLGMKLDQAQVQRGKNFVSGVVDRVGEHQLGQLFAAANSLPTPAELEAPGLWVARLEL